MVSLLLAAILLGVAGLAVGVVALFYWDDLRLGRFWPDFDGDGGAVRDEVEVDVEQLDEDGLRDRVKSLSKDVGRLREEKSALEDEVADLQTELEDVREENEWFYEKVNPEGAVELTPPDVSAGLLDYVRVTRHLKRRQRLAKKGYVRWFRLDSQLSRPTWVKPEQDGSGEPKVTVDGQPYYFPREAMVTDQLTGAWVALHREGEADPINLRDPAYPGLEVDLVERVINLEAEDDPPGMFDDLFGGMDQTTLMYLAVGVAFLIYAAFRYMGGAM